MFRRALVVAGLALATAAGGCTSGSRVTSPTTSAPPVTAGGTTTLPPAAGSAAALQQAFVSVVARVRPQVVLISTGAGLGSGVVYDTRGDIVTNAHVVAGATSLTVQLVSGQQLAATLVGTYTPEDLAVIRVTGARNLSPATFGDSKALQVGDIVLAVGNPLGLSSSVTEGIVSYNGRPVSEGNGVTLSSTIQTSAAINPGNSGGALVDLQGQVVGIPTLAAVNQQAGGTAAGIGFAVPSSTVKLIAPQLISSGRVTQSNRAALDISAADAVDNQGNPAGVIVTATIAGGSAARAGIVAGDLITAINGKQVTNLADLQTTLAQLTPGTTASVTVTGQSGASRSVSVTLDQLRG